MHRTKLPKTLTKTLTKTHEKVTVPASVPDSEIDDLRRNQMIWERRRFDDMLNESEQESTQERAIPEEEEITQEKVEPIISSVNGSRPLPIQPSSSSFAKIARSMQKTPANSPNVCIADVLKSVEKVAEELDKLAKNSDSESSSSDDESLIFAMDEDTVSDENTPAQSSRGMRLN